MANTGLHLRINGAIGRRLRTMENGRLERERINLGRAAALRRHVEAGGKCLVDLGCGDGIFSARLAGLQRQWMVGVDVFPEKIFPGEGPFGPDNYRRHERVILFIACYRDLLKEWDRKYSWLSGAADKVFMVMPYPFIGGREEVELWRRLAAPGGELHVRTENGRVKSGLRRTISFPVAEIPFDRPAAAVDSTYSAGARRRNYEIFSFGLKLA